MSDVRTPEQVILRVLQLVKRRVGKPIHRTHLVKMVYLVDYIYSQHAGESLTGLRYASDHFGPNAWGNQIVKRADVLEDAGLIRITEEQNPSGSFKFLYEATDALESPVRDDLAERVIADVVKQFGSKGWREAVAAAKRTKPYLEAAKGQQLHFQSPREDLRPILEEVRRREEAGRYNVPRRGTGLRELMARDGSPK